MTALPYSLMEPASTQIGMLVLQSDETLEADLRRLMPSTVELLVSRVPSSTEVTAETLGKMAGELTKAAELLPRGATCKAVGYGCTSATAQLGSGKVAELIGAGVKTKQITEPVSALVAACKSQNVSNIGMISPYIAEVSSKLQMTLAENGIATRKFASFNEPIEASVVRITQASVKDAAIAMGKDGNCDAIFLSCTNLRTLDVIDQIEQAIGKPVMSSNQVLAWDLLRRTSVPERGETPGCLWQAS